METRLSHGKHASGNLGNTLQEQNMSMCCKRRDMATMTPARLVENLHNGYNTNMKKGDGPMQRQACHLNTTATKNRPCIIVNCVSWLIGLEYVDVQGLKAQL